MIIGIHGLKQSGKSTMAAAFEPFGFKRESFASPIKKMLAVLGVPEENLHGADEMKNAPLPLFGGKSARFLMQRCGTEFGRDMISPTLWADLLVARLDPLQSYVVDDLRFTSEFAAMTKAGAFTICIVRPELSASTTPVDGHRSEEGLPKEYFNCCVTNNGTRENLVNCAGWLAKTLSEGRSPLVKHYKTSRFVI